VCWALLTYTGQQAAGTQRTSSTPASTPRGTERGSYCPPGPLRTPTPPLGHRCARLPPSSSNTARPLGADPAMFLHAPPRAPPPLRCAHPLNPPAPRTRTRKTPGVPQAPTTTTATTTTKLVACSYTVKHWRRAIPLRSDRPYLRIPQRSHDLQLKVATVDLHRPPPLLHRRARWALHVASRGIVGTTIVQFQVQFTASKTPVAAHERDRLCAGQCQHPLPEAV
jgi:hypothetical protein